MGLRYVTFRIFYELRLRSGVLKRAFPVRPQFKTWITLDEWRKSAPLFFFASRAEVKPIAESDLLREHAQRILNGEIQFFNGGFRVIPHDSWTINPSNNFQYDITKHWTEIPDWSPINGDIKYVWEKSRFTFLQTLLRYDTAFHQDSSAFVFQQILSWIEHNPVNQGPNYRCSQEISIRVFNWLLALYFYRDSANLTNDKFSKIIFAIYWQLRHVRSNIHFSRIAVRNNHAITETLALYTAGKLFPFFRESHEWMTSGKKWFEEEIEYQVYEDGTYLQFSVNYHRVVVQLLTWGIQLAKVHRDEFKRVVYDRAYASLKFLLTSQDPVSGQLPNYGANDGSLFFKWDESEFRDFRSSLDALHFLLTGKNYYPIHFGDRYWFNLKGANLFPAVVVPDGTHEFPAGGVFIYRSNGMLVWVTCTNYVNRPSQADALHLDLWYDGKNVLRDAGSFGYNTTAELVKYFAGTESHNTVAIENYDQMTKASRFVWLNWSRAITGGWSRKNGHVVFEGAASVYQNLGDIVHHRTIAINQLSLEVTDKIQGAGNLRKRQLWHSPPDSEDSLKIESFAGKTPLKPITKQSWYSPTYGQMEKSTQLEFETTESTISTTIYLE